MIQISKEGDDMTIKETARLVGVSVRTLHYYDGIGLLCPSAVTEAGYRIYGKTELMRLQQILFFRELGFPLKEIKKIMENPDFDEREALLKQRELLEMKRERLTNLVRLIDKTLKGGTDMSFQEFDASRIEAVRQEYVREAEERWGGSAAYQQSKEKAAGYGKSDWMRLETEMGARFCKFAEHMELPAKDEKVQALVRDWQQYITANYYACTNEILAGLGKMYLADKRFAEYINRYGDGLAEFISEAIACYCK